MSTVAAVDSNADLTIITSQELINRIDPNPLSSRKPRKHLTSDRKQDEAASLLRRFSSTHLLISPPSDRIETKQKQIERIIKESKNVHETTKSESCQKQSRGKLFMKDNVGATIDQQSKFQDFHSELNLKNILFHAKTSSDLTLLDESLKKYQSTGSALKSIAKALPFTSAMELRIMDLITGTDPMEEGDISVEDQERKRLEEESRKAALGLTGEQKMLLEDRYKQFKESFQNQMKNVARQFAHRIQNRVDIFNQEWEKTAKDIENILEIITTDKLAETSKSHLDDLKGEAISMRQQRERLLSTLLDDLKHFEHDRAITLTSNLQKLSESLRKINFMPPLVSTRMLQDECVLINQTLIENRNSAIDFITQFRLVNDKEHKEIVAAFEAYGQKWNQARFEYVHKNFEKTVQKALDVPIQALYESYQTKFDASVAFQVDLVGAIVKLSFKTLSIEWVNGWRARVKGSTQKQDSDIYGFRQDLLDFEQRMDNHAKDLFDQWYPSFDECHVVSDQNGALKKLIQDIVQRFRKTSELLAGKRAAMLLTSQASRNHDVLDKVGEFIVCLIATKKEYAERMAESELEVVSKLHDLRETTAIEKRLLERALEKEMNGIKSETTEIGVSKRLAKCMDVIKSIDECLLKFEDHSKTVVKSLHDLIRSVQKQYQDKISSMFVVNAELTSSTDIKPIAQQRSKGNDMTISTIDNASPSSGEYDNSLNVDQNNANGPEHLPPTSTENPQPTSADNVEQALENHSTLIRLKSPRNNGDGYISSIREIEFFSKKVADWRTEQAAVLKAKIAQQEHDAHVAKLRRMALRAKQQQKMANTSSLSGTGSNSTQPGTNMKDENDNANISIINDKQSISKRMLLNGEEYTPCFDAGTILQAAGYPEDLNSITYISDQTIELDRNVVEIVRLPSQILGLLRQHLEKAVKEDMFQWHEAVEKAVAQKISRKLDQISVERSIQMIQNEKRMCDVEDLANKRSSSIPHLRLSHENEANMLLYKLYQLKENYANAVAKIVSLSQSFGETIVKPLSEKIQNASNVTAIHKIQKVFQDELKSHTMKMRNILTDATDRFDQASMAILKSRQAGRHSAAWTILSDGRYVTVEDLPRELDNFRTSFDDQIDRVQGDMSKQVSLLMSTINSYVHDYEFLAKVDQVIGRMKTKIRAEIALCNTWQNELRDFIQLCVSWRMNAKPKTWTDLVGMMEQIEKGRLVTISIATFLECFGPTLMRWVEDALSKSTTRKPNPTDMFVNTCRKTIEEWETSKLSAGPSVPTHHDSRSINQINEYSISADTSTYSKHQESIRADLNESKLSSPSQETLHDVSEGTISKTPDLKNNLDLKKDIESGNSLIGHMEIEPKEALSLTSSNIEHPDSESLNKQSADVQSRPSSGKELSSSNSVKKNNSRKSSTVHFRPNTNEIVQQQQHRTDSRENSAGSNRRRDLIAQGARRSASPHMRGDESRPYIENPIHILDMFEKWRRDTRSQILDLTEAVFEKRFELKDIPRTNRIPATASMFMSSIDDAFQIIEKRVEETRVMETKRFIESLGNFLNEVGHVCRFIQTNIYENQVQQVTKAWHISTSRFAQSRSVVYRQKHECDRTLKLAMGHPRYANELTTLCQKAEHSHRSFISIVNDLKESLLNTLESLTVEFLHKLEYTTARFAGLYDGAILPNVDVVPLASSPVSDSLASIPTDGMNNSTNRCSSVTFGNPSDEVKIAKVQAPYLPCDNRQVWDSLPLDKIPLARFSMPGFYISEVIRSRKGSTLHEELIHQRNTIFEAFVSELKRRVDLLSEHVSVEMEAERQWMDLWDQRVSRVRAAHH